MGLLDRLFGREGRTEVIAPSPSDAARQNLYRFMLDEAVQNAGVPSHFHKVMASGAAVEQLPGAIGEFGRSPTNPIPVNGPGGELAYISRMTLPGGCPIIGHRIGSFNLVDIYETVALDGSRWDLLFFDPYHPRKSGLLPGGYIGSSTPEQFLFATNSIVSSFPVGIPEALDGLTTRLFGGSLRPLALKDAALLSGFIRPTEHARALQALRFQGRTRGPGAAAG
jgi:hypothetical protein